MLRFVKIRVTYAFDFCKRSVSLGAVALREGGHTLTSQKNCKALGSHEGLPWAFVYVFTVRRHRHKKRQKMKVGLDIMYLRLYLYLVALGTVGTGYWLYMVWEEPVELTDWQKAQIDQIEEEQTEAFNAFNILESTADADRKKSIDIINRRMELERQYQYPEGLKGERLQKALAALLAIWLIPYLLLKTTERIVSAVRKQKSAEV